MQKLLVLFVALLVPFTFASRPPANVVAETATGGDGPAVQSIGGSTSAQPVDIMNWVIDENGNVRVSSQVRDQVIVLADSLVTIPALGGIYESPWFSTRTFNVMYVHGPVFGINCGINWRWTETIPTIDQSLATRADNGSMVFDPAHPWRVAGPEARIVCVNNNETDATFDFVAVYLRAE